MSGMREEKKVLLLSLISLLSTTTLDHQFNSLIRFLQISNSFIKSTLCICSHNYSLKSLSLADQKSWINRQSDFIEIFHCGRLSSVLSCPHHHNSNSIIVSLIALRIPNTSDWLSISMLHIIIIPGGVTTSKHKQNKSPFLYFQDEEMTNQSWS